MIPTPQNIADALSAARPRGFRLLSKSTPRNMHFKVKAGQEKCWAHSTAAGHLWEFGFSAARAIRSAEKINSGKNNSCAVAKNQLSHPRCNEQHPAGRSPENVRRPRHNTTKTMTTITDTAAIVSAFASFAPCSQGAQPTNRLIAGASSAMDPQEWSERGTINGKDATVFYIFSEEEASDEDASNYPWDSEHVDRIEIEDDDAGSARFAWITNGGYDTLAIIEDGKVVSQWTVTPAIAAEYAAADGPEDWDRNYPDCEVLEDYGTEVTGEELAARLAFFGVESPSE